MTSINFRAKEYKLWRLIVQTQSAMWKARMRELHQNSISPWEAGITYRVHALGNQSTPAEISRWLLREPHTVSAVIKRLEKEGIVRKVKDLERKNMIRVELTDKGLELLKRASKRETIHRILSALSLEEQKLLQSLLGKIRNRAIEEIGFDPTTTRI
jgi:DNA-binding MarR family transcriptional regulator